MHHQLAANLLPEEAIAVIAPGTGLGESFLTWDGCRYMAHSSEGGHSDFAPTDERQIHLLEYMLKLFDHVSFEHVCSGIGIPHIYSYLRDVEHLSGKAGDRRRKLIDAAGDPSVVIISKRLMPSIRASCARLPSTVSFPFWRSEAGNLAVKFLATGGVYVAGGVAVHTLPVIKQPVFIQRFKRKGRFDELMGRIPLHVIVTPAGLTGAAVCGLEGFGPDAVLT